MNAIRWKDLNKGYVRPLLNINCVLFDPVWVSVCMCEEDIMMTKKGNKKFSEGLLKNIKIYFNEIKKKWVSGWMDERTQERVTLEKHQ